MKNIDLTKNKHLGKDILTSLAISPVLSIVFLAPSFIGTIPYDFEWSFELFFSSTLRLAAFFLFVGLSIYLWQRFQELAFGKEYQEDQEETLSQLDNHDKRDLFVEAYLEKAKIFQGLEGWSFINKEVVEKAQSIRNDYLKGYRLGAYTGYERRKVIEDSESDYSLGFECTPDEFKAVEERKKKVEKNSVHLDGGSKQERTKEELLDAIRDFRSQYLPKGVHNYILFSMGHNTRLQIDQYEREAREDENFFYSKGFWEGYWEGFENEDWEDLDG